MQLVKTKRAMCLAVAIAACVVMLAGCAGESSVPDASAPSSASASHSFAVVGTQVGAVSGIVLENALGGEVGSISLHAAGAKDKAESLPIAGSWADGEDALVFIPASYSTGLTDLVLTVGKAEYVLHDIDFSTFKVGQVCLDGTIAYLAYVPRTYMESTLEHERYLITKAEAEQKAKEAAAAKKKAAKAEEEAKAAQEAAAQSAAQAEAAWTQAQTQQQYYYEEPAVEEAPATETATENGQGGN